MFLVVEEDIYFDTLEELILFLKEMAQKGEEEGCIQSRRIYDLRNADPVIQKIAVVSLGGEFGSLEVSTQSEEEGAGHIFLDTPENSLALYQRLVKLLPKGSFEMFPGMYQGDNINGEYDLLDLGFLPAEVVLGLVWRYFADDAPAREIAREAGLALRNAGEFFDERTGRDQEGNYSPQ